MPSLHTIYDDSHTWPEITGEQRGGYIGIQVGRRPELLCCTSPLRGIR